MTLAELKGKVQTVLGAIDSDSLGITLLHEHVLTDLSAYFVEPTEATERKRAYEPVGLENRSWVKLNRLTSLDNLRLTDEEVAIKEALLFKAAGGNTIVEMSSIGLCRDPLGLSRIARATGLNMIMGTGYYVGVSHPPGLAGKTEEEIAEELVNEITVGVGSTGIRAGVIGEIGCSPPLEEGERKVLRAAAIAQRRTGVAINVHPGPTDDLALEIVQILDDAGADLSRTAISHVDMFGFRRSTLRQIADAGCYLEYDTFGHEGLHPPYLGHILSAPSDMQRIYDIIALISEGYLDRLLMSTDHCYKHLLVTYGGYGYAHIPRDVVPMLRRMGISNEEINTLLVKNPKRFLTST